MQKSELFELADEIRAETADTERRQMLQNLEALYEEEFSNGWARVGQSWSFAILDTDRVSRRDRFFHQGAQRFRELGAILVRWQWDKYLPLVIERAEQSKEPMADAELYLAQCLYSACDKATKAGEIAKALAVAAEKWPLMQDDLVRGLRVSLWTLHQHGGKWPTEEEPAKTERANKASNAAPAGLQADPSAYVAAGTLWRTKFTTYARFKKWLDGTPSTVIRRDRLNSQRLTIHAGDWHKYWAAQDKATFGQLR
jgi:hypothetical protein